MSEVTSKWNWEITGQTSYWGASLQELWSYRHLLGALVKRDFLLRYQQTVLGPFWGLFPPIMTLVTYVLVFGKFVGIPTDTLPPVLFYFAGIILWSFFNNSFSGTSAIFRDNIHLFSKVYFPRLVMPASVISTHFSTFLIQLFLMLLLIAYYALFQGLSLPVSAHLLWFPVAVATTAALALGLGLLFSVITAKYRDMGHLVSLGVRLLMYVTPVIYPLSSVPEKVRWVVQLNPLTPLFEAFRLSLLGEGTLTGAQVLYSIGFAGVVLVVAMLLFNKQGDKLIDVV
ncbi:ABC transporter permease [Pontibacter mangrovi]|uniref:Transport permease protein n=1 Tax=Pontibacter mangrovi TaxID=2589816 RepID=A0A501W894_9BACT|nr:ABC transporter permease [Pontibacter mangrovi]TPE43491.1 ABC transporter permease [Pontibacter mangrovi]